ncbi:hypothetical protein ACH4FA_34250 [Streptomyces sp. NPDC017966]|uniref:hypothetical protein n=1 Tax=Streptomyces sp. NPDC017966 TaxID=3365023 RepID=UPI0037A3BA84
MDDSLSFESFLKGARKASHRAMDDHGHGEYDEFALHGGVAVERLAKAALVKRNPVYLLDMNKGNPDLLLYFGGHLDMDADKIRTVGAKDAIRRLRSLDVLPPSPQLDKLIELRNGTAHMTVGDEAKSLLPPLAETIAVLLTDIGMSTEQFWGRWTSTIGAAVDKQRNAIQRDVEIRIKQARHLFDDRFKDLPEGTKEQILQNPLLNADTDTAPLILALRHGGDELITVLIQTICPACNGRAQVRFPLSDIKESTLIPDNLSCPFCRLDLNGIEEITTSKTHVGTLTVTDLYELYWNQRVRITPAAEAHGI